MARYNRAFVLTRFGQWAADFGLSTECWTFTEGKPARSNVGAVELDYNAAYGGYSIHQIANEHGAVTVLTGTGNRMTAAELVAFFDGARWAKRHSEE